MKKIAFFVGLFASVSAFAQTDEVCLKLLEMAESKESQAVYDECLFKDKEQAWTKWAPLLSQNQYKRAMFELSKHYPDHEYAGLYLKKSADLGYVPALYAQAEQNFNQDNASEGVRLLEKIVAENPWPNTKFVAQTQTDEAVLKAYALLGLSYFSGNGVGRYLNSAIAFLSVAAGMDDPVAANVLGVALWERGYPSDDVNGERSFWKAALKGCPAAEENLSILSLYKSGRLKKDIVLDGLRKRALSCTKPLPAEPQADKQRQDCDCIEVLNWEKTNRNKPYTLISTNDNRAVLEDKKGERMTVYLNKHAGDYIVEEIHPTAVILKRRAERVVLLLQKDQDCLPLCREAQSSKEKILRTIPPFSFTFTDDECSILTRYLESLNQPDATDIRGLSECSMKDADRWGETALSRKADKHLYLLGNYQKSRYLPAYVALAEHLVGQGDEASMKKASDLLVSVINSSPTDALSAKERERAFCVKAKMYLSEGPLPDEESAVVWAAAGVKEDYPQSLNLLGILYARGEGVEQNLDYAAELFRQADEAAVYPFIEAKQNEYLIKTGGSLDGLKTGNCADVLNPPKSTLQSFIKYYQ